MTFATLEHMALPEGVYALVEATLYLATASKPNSANDYFKAYAKVEVEGKVQVPQHLQDGTPSAATPATWATVKATSARTSSPATMSASSICPQRCWVRTSVYLEKKATKRT